MKQEKFTDIEYSFHKKKTKREEFLEIMDEIIPWDEWVGVIKPYYPTGKRGRPPMGIEKMLRMYLLQIWFNLSDPATEDTRPFIRRRVLPQNRNRISVSYGSSSNCRLTIAASESIPLRRSVFPAAM